MSTHWTAHNRIPLSIRSWGSDRSPLPTLVKAYNSVTIVAVRNPLVGQVGPHDTLHNIHIKRGIAIHPVTLGGTDHLLEGQGVVETSFLRQVEIGVVKVMVDCNEHLSLCGIHQCIVLEEEEKEEEEEASG